MSKGTATEFLINKESDKAVSCCVLYLTYTLSMLSKYGKNES